MTEERVCAVAPIDQETWDTEVREPVVRCRDCARWDRCPVRRTDAPKVGPPLMRCSACGTESPWLSKEDRFCRFCGARVVDGDV